MRLRFLFLFMTILLAAAAPAHARSSSSCPVMQDDQIAIQVNIRRNAPTFYDGEGWRVQSEADAKVKASGIAGMNCYYIVAATVTITMSGMTSDFAPAQVVPDKNRIRATVARLLRSRNGVALPDPESGRWQRNALNDINRVAHQAITELKD